MAEISFTVGRPGDHRSAIWQLRTRGNAAYVHHCGTQGRDHRFSFSRNSTGCRWAEVGALRPGARKTMLEWTRGSVPPPGSGVPCLLMAVVFPTSHLAIADTPIPDSMHWIDPAPAGWAVRIEFILADTPQSAGADLLRLSPHQELLFYLPLRSGLCVCAVASIFDCGPVEVPLPRRPSRTDQVLGDTHFPEHDGHATERPIRILLVGDNVQPPDIWELSGYEAVQQ
jgi:hypothetical protein